MEALDTFAMGETGSIEYEKPVQLFIQPDGLLDESSDCSLIAKQAEP